MSKAQKPKSLIGTIFGFILDILVILSIFAVIVSGYTAIKYKDNPGDAYLMGYKPILVLTGSMEPTMHVNAICIAEKVEYEDVKVGDIIMFQVDDKLITHRVTNISDSGITTKGDNNNVEDAYSLTADNVKAKVVSIWNWTAPLINFGIEKVLIIAAVLIFMICMIVHFIKKLIKMDDDENENSKEDEGITSAEIESEVGEDSKLVVEEKITEENASSIGLAEDSLQETKEE